jgi:hypothetical protein
MSKTVLYIGAGVLFFVALCFLLGGGFMIYGSFGAGGDPAWRGWGLGMGLIALLPIAGGILLVYLAMRGQKTEVVQQVTMQVDLPGDTKIEEMKCRSCGGVLTVNDIKLVNGAPMVNCPYCGTVYQLTEEPKW